MLRAQNREILSLNRAVELGLKKSYEMKLVESRLAESRHSLNAWKKSYSTYANLEAYAPVLTDKFSEIPDPQTGKIRIVRQNNTSYRSSLVISQPVPFSDGTLSLYNSLYHLRQGSDLTYQSDVTLNLNQPLFKTSMRKISLQQAEYNLQKSEISYTRQKRELIYNITESFLFLLRAQKNLQIARESEQRSRDVYRIAVAKYNSGLFSEMDILQIEVQVSNDQNTLMNEEEACQKKMEQFKLLLGLAREDTIDVLDEIKLEPIAVPESELFEQALMNSPERLLNETDVKLAKVQVKQEKAMRQFTIDMNLQYGFSQIKDEFEALFKKPEMTRIANISFFIPLWDSGQNRERVLAAQEQLTGLNIELNRSIESLKIEIKQILFSLHKAEKALALSQGTENKAEKSFQYSLMQFNTASITSDELNMALQRLNTARLNNLNAKIEYMLAVEKIKKHLTPIGSSEIANQ